jgi:hypothetical protein
MHRGRRTASCRTPILLAVGSLSRKQTEDSTEDEHERNEAEMVTQREVLTFIARRTEAGRGVAAQDLAEKFWLALSLDAACGHLRRLWRERLIETGSVRSPKFRFRLEPGEPILPLRFSLTGRGRERLRWYERQDEDGGPFGLFK